MFSFSRLTPRLNGMAIGSFGTTSVKAIQPTTTSLFGSHSCLLQSQRDNEQPQEKQQDQKDAKKVEASIPGKANELLEAVLYGSKKIKEEDAQTHSKVLARGKYVHELSKHKVRPDKVEEYIDLVTTHYPRIANEPLNDLHLCGSWEIVVGELDTFVHIWEYKGYPGHQHTMERLNQDPEHAEFMKKLRPLLVSRENNMMLEFSFWKTSPANHQWYL
ncbi:unnamed protein product [Absidia cylindrospora]